MTEDPTPRAPEVLTDDEIEARYVRELTVAKLQAARAILTVNEKESCLISGDDLAALEAAAEMFDPSPWWRRAWWRIESWWWRATHWLRRDDGEQTETAEWHESGPQLWPNADGEMVRYVETFPTTTSATATRWRHRSATSILTAKVRRS